MESSAPTRVLVVANQTLGGEALASHLRRIMDADSGARFVVMVPLSTTSNILITRGKRPASTTYILVSSGEKHRPLGRLTSPMATVTRPVLFMVGEKDGTTPAAMRQMHEALGGSTFVQLPGAGHISNLDQPDACTRALQEFLSPA